MSTKLPFNVCGYRFHDAKEEIISFGWEVGTVNVIQPPYPKKPFGCLRVIRQEIEKEGKVALLVAFETYQ